HPRPASRAAPRNRPARRDDSLTHRRNSRSPGPAPPRREPRGTRGGGYGVGSQHGQESLMVRLDHLVNVLGGYGVRLRSCPVSRATMIRSVAVHDATGSEAAPGDIFLAVGAGSVSEAVHG